MKQEELETTFRMADTYQPFDLLRLSKDAFYDVIAQEFSANNDNINVSIEDANLEFDVETVEYCDYVYIKVEILEYTVL